MLFSVYRACDIIPRSLLSSSLQLFHTVSPTQLDSKRPRRLQARSMMDIYALYDLPPPPPPTIFSRDSGPHRARFPTFTSGDEVADFLQRALIWQGDAPAVNALCIFTIVWLLALELLVFFCILRKISRGSWWVLRVASHPNGLRIGYHSTWAVTLGIFSLLLVAGLLELLIYTARGQPEPHICLWLALLWVPIPYAGWFQIWGLRLAREEVQQHATATRSLWSRLPNYVIICIHLLIPAIPAFVAATPGFMSNQHFGRAVTLWGDWQQKYGDETHLSRDMLLGAQGIWNEYLRASFIVTFAFCGWLVTTVVMTYVYWAESWRFVVEIRKILGSKQERVRNSQSPQTVPSRGDTMKLRPIEGGPAQHLAPSVYERPRTIRDVLDDQIRSQLFTEAELQENRSRSFFPAVTPSAAVIRLDPSDARRIIMWFCIGTLSTLGGCVFFGASLIYFISCFYAAAERNEGQQVALTAFSVVCVSCMGLGATTSVSIIHPTYEASFAALLNSSRDINPGDEQKPGDSWP
ncbi:hypothetical protein V8E36_000851 [Tilletia maclaganii]